MLNVNIEGLTSNLQFFSFYMISKSKIYEKKQLILNRQTDSLKENHVPLHAL